MIVEQPQVHRVCLKVSTAFAIICKPYKFGFLSVGSIFTELAHKATQSISHDGCDTRILYNFVYIFESTITPIFKGPRSKRFHTEKWWKEQSLKIYNFG